MLAFAFYQRNRVFVIGTSGYLYRQVKRNSLSASVVCMCSDVASVFACFICSVHVTGHFSKPDVQHAFMLHLNNAAIMKSCSY